MPEKKNSQRLTKPEKLRNARLCNNDKSALYLPRQDSGVKVLEGNYCDKLRQIGAIGLVGYYGFTTIEETKNQKCEIMVREMKKGIFWTFVLFR